MPNRIASGDKVTLSIDLTGMFSFLGAGAAISRSMRTKKYSNSLFDVAFAEVDEEFNVRAAAFASVSGKLNHMYEWGTLGINKGKTNMRPNPMSPAARLWETTSVGSGFDRTLTYYFKPSVAFVPKPTARDTGMDPAVIAKMRNHIFEWKAEIMEWGRVVTITPDEAKWLLIPITKENSAEMKSRDPRRNTNNQKRGYVLSPGPITIQTGAKYANNFTVFFAEFWQGEGGELIEASVERQFMLDYEPKLKFSARYSAMVPAYANKNIPARVEAQAKKYQRAVEIQARSRATAANAKRRTT